MCIHYSYNSNREVLAEYVGTGAHPFGLDVLEGYLYWTDVKQMNLQKVNQSTGENSTVLIQNFQQPRDVHAFHRRRNHDGIEICLYTYVFMIMYVCIYINTLYVLTSICLLVENNFVMLENHVYNYVHVYTYIIIL